MRCDCLCCVMSGDGMRCHGDELLSVVPCNGMECYELRMPLVVRSLWWLQSTTLSTKYYSSTSLYYKYYSVLQSTTMYYSLQYYTVLLQYYSVPQSSTPPLLSTTKWSTTLCILDTYDWSASHMKRHLRCAEQQESSCNFTKYCACHAKMVLMIDPRHTWNVIYIARSNKSHPSNSPSTAPATEFGVQDLSEKSLNCFRQYQAIRPWSDHDPRIYNPTIKPSSRTRRFGDLTRPILETILYWKIQHFARRLSPKISRNTAPATKSHTPPSPNTAPATQNESHDWSASHMKHLFSLCI